MTTPTTTRRRFLSNAALTSAALGLFAPQAHTEAHAEAAAAAPTTSPAPPQVADWFYSQKDWDRAPFDKLLHAKKAVKQVFDMTAAEGDQLAFHVHSSMTGLERGFGVPANKILMVAALRAEASVLNFNDHAWKKYQIGALLKIDDPKTKKPAERNPFYASSVAPDGHYPTQDPNDPRAIEFDASLQAAQRRGLQLLCCHVAIEHFSRMILHHGKLQVSQESIAQDLVANVLPGVIVVPSMVSAIPMLETYGHFTYLRL